MVMSRGGIAEPSEAEDKQGGGMKRTGDGTVWQSNVKLWKRIASQCLGNEE